MNQLKCLIVDDEPLAIDLVAAFLTRLDLHDITRCDSSVEAFRLLHQDHFDVLFLDIEMPLLNGIDLLRHLKPQPAVIITTAYRDFAVEGFELHVTDYLVKPFSFARFLQAMEKITAPNVQAAAQTAQKEIVIKSDRQLIKLSIPDILFIESKRDYILISTAKGEFLCLQSLGSITDLLPKDKFFRIHRSFTVALDKIERYRDHQVLIQGKLIPVSREHRQTLQNLLRS